MGYSRRCVAAVLATAACTCCGTIVAMRWSGTDRMTVHDAITRLDLLGAGLTDAQAAVLAAALGREALSAIAGLRSIAGRGGRAAHEAATRLRQAEEALR